jgi:uncharacterized protein YxeA
MNKIIMKVTLLFIVFLGSSMAAFAQNEGPTNSFEQQYKKSNPAINYRYDSAKQIHDYSNNWDFDADGKMDEVYFVGTGGAHLYYFLRIILSSDHIKRDYFFLESDLPMLPADGTLKEPAFNLITSFTQFYVFDYDKDNVNDIFLRLDTTAFEIGKKVLEKRGVKTQYVIISFKGKNVQFKDYQ